MARSFEGAQYLGFPFSIDWSGRAAEVDRKRYIASPRRAVASDQPGRARASDHARQRRRPPALQTGQRARGRVDADCCGGGAATVARRSDRTGQPRYQRRGIAARGYGFATSSAKPAIPISSASKRSCDGLLLRIGDVGGRPSREATDDQGDAFVNGMDFVEVVPGFAQRVLDVHFIHPLPGEAGAVPPAPALDATNFRGRRQPSHTGKNAIAVDTVTVQDNVARVTLDDAGDFAFYDLMLVANEISDSPPAGFDPQLAILRFSFKAACPTDTDCRELLICDDDSEPSPYIDYRARDFESFNRVLTDRLRQLLPRWRGDSPVDQTAALVDLFSVHRRPPQLRTRLGRDSGLFGHGSRADRRSAARPGYATTGCTRGNNARAWISVDVSGLATVPQGTRIVAGAPDQHRLASAGKFTSMDPRRSAVFETMHEQQLDPSSEPTVHLHVGRGRLCAVRGFDERHFERPGCAAGRLPAPGAGPRSAARGRGTADRVPGGPALGRQDYVRRERNRRRHRRCSHPRNVARGRCAPRSASVSRAVSTTMS